MAEDKTSFVWDTTASNPKKIDLFLNKGYDVYMVMVYSHPVIAYISNAKRQRRVPSSAVFSTWRNVYKLIENYNKKLKGNLSIFINDRGGEFSKYVEEFMKLCRTYYLGHLILTSKIRVGCEALSFLSELLGIIICNNIQKNNTST